MNVRFQAMAASHRMPEVGAEQSAASNAESLVPGLIAGHPNDRPGSTAAVRANRPSGQAGGPRADSASHEHIGGAKRRRGAPGLHKDGSADDQPSIKLVPRTVALGTVGADGFRRRP
jgi:hypothetical protein